MKCPECKRNVGFSRTCPYCDTEIRQTAKDILKEGTKVLINELQWKSIILFTLVSCIVIGLMIVTGIKCHDFGLMQWEILRRHVYWIAPLFIVLCILSAYTNVWRVPQHTLKGRIFKWTIYCGLLILMVIIIMNRIYE